MAIDIGGTFTDGLMIDHASGVVKATKVLTTPHDPSVGFLNAAQRLLDLHEKDSGDDINYVSHATTVASNAVLERRGAIVGLLVTRGFRDILEIARQVRHELYNLQTEKPRPLVSRMRCIEIVERLDYAGRQIVPLDEDSVRSAVRLLQSLGATSVAICFLHSYKNPEHELAAAEIVHEIAPELEVSISSAIAPQIREYWRASTTTLNAYIAPVVRGYLERLEQRLATLGCHAPINIMQSSGGAMGLAAAKSRPIQILESGPAAGVMAARYFAQAAGFDDVITFDMGGTTAKVGTITGGEASVVHEFEAGSGAGTGAHVARASGYPVLFPCIDLVEVSAGGGSVAWVDEGGLLRVGPESAGADPGPAAYGLGGSVPTVTDANLVLGRISPDYFLGGEMRLNVEAARTAIDSHCAQPLGIGLIDAALGIVEIAASSMAEAMRLVSVERGVDPSSFALVATGGAGPLHAVQLAAELRIPTVLIPPTPGVASAFGMMVTDVRDDQRVTRLSPVDKIDPESARTEFSQLEARAQVNLRSQGIAEHDVRITRYFDMRYEGQTWTLGVELPPPPWGSELRDAAVARFESLHRERYGFTVEGEPVEILNLALTATGPLPEVSLPSAPHGGSVPSSHARKRARDVWWGAQSLPTDVFERDALQPGNILQGPVIVEEMDSTVLIPPQSIGEILSDGALKITLGGSSSEQADEGVLLAGPR